jgi:hypothetical protein
MSSDGVHIHETNGYHDHGGVEFVSTATNKTPLVGVVTTSGVVGDHHHHHHHHHSHSSGGALGDGFITMDNSSQGTND